MDSSSRSFKAMSPGIFRGRAMLFLGGEAGSTSPRASISASLSSRVRGLAGTRRATGVPYSVITTSLPCLTSRSAQLKLALASRTPRYGPSNRHWLSLGCSCEACSLSLEHRISLLSRFAFCLKRWLFSLGRHLSPRPVIPEDRPEGFRANTITPLVTTCGHNDRIRVRGASSSERCRVG